MRAAHQVPARDKDIFEFLNLGISVLDGLQLDFNHASNFLLAILHASVFV